MNKVLLAVATGLIGAAVLHIIIILSVPHFTGRDAYTRVQAEGEANDFHPLSADIDEAGLSNMDPFLRTAVCHFDTTSAPVRLLAQNGRTFWSVAIFDADANEVFSMNDRTSVDGVLDVLIASPQQVARIRRAPPDALSQSIIVEMPARSGYAVLRIMVPQPSFEEGAKAFLSEAACAQFAGL